MVRRREVLIGPDRRLRFTMELDRGRPRSWAVQLEWYDPHRDRNRIAAHEPVDLPQDPGKAARVAETDLARRAEEYIEAYRAAKAQGKEAW
jgi:hypothetical protein